MAVKCYDAILFDVGYTLVEFHPPQEAVVQEALQTMGVDRSVRQIRDATEQVWGRFYQDAATATFPATPEYDRTSQLALSQDLLAHLEVQPTLESMLAYSKAVDQAFGRPGVIRPYPEVHSVLHLLKARGYRLGIVSNWGWNLRDRLAQAGLAEWFEVVWASAYAGCSKPHPAIFLQAMALFPQPQPRLERVLHVGDSYGHDVVGARNAGLDAVLLRRDGGEEPRDCPVISDLWGILGILQESCSFAP